MLNRDTLVTEIPVDLKHAIETADHQALQVELGSDAQKQIHLQGIMVGHKRFGCRAAGDRLHHRRFNFQVIVGNHIVTQQTDNVAAFAEYLTNLGIDHQIQIALPIAGLHVRQTMPFFR